MRGPFSVFFSSPYRGLFSEWPILALTIGRRKIDASASRCFLFPLTMETSASASASRHVASFSLSGLGTPFPFSSSDCKCSSCLAPCRLVKSHNYRCGREAQPKPNRPTGAVRGAVVSAETAICAELLLFGKDRSLGEASAAIYRLPSNYQIPH